MDGSVFAINMIISTNNILYCYVILWLKKGERGQTIPKNNILCLLLIITQVVDVITWCKSTEKLIICGYDFRVKYSMIHTNYLVYKWRRRLNNNCRAIVLCVNVNVPGIVYTHFILEESILFESTLQSHQKITYLTDKPKLSSNSYSKFKSLYF